MKTASSTVVTVTHRAKLTILRPARWEITPNCPWLTPKLPPQIDPGGLPVLDRNKFSITTTCAVIYCDYGILIRSPCYSGAGDRYSIGSIALQQTLRSCNRGFWREQHGGKSLGGSSASVCHSVPDAFAISSGRSRELCTSVSITAACNRGPRVPSVKCQHQPKCCGKRDHSAHADCKRCWPLSFRQACLRRVHDSSLLHTGSAGGL